VRPPRPRGDIDRRAFYADAILGDTFIAARSRLPRFRFGAITAIALAAGLVTWLVFRFITDGKPVSPAPSAAAVPEIVAPARLRSLAAALGHPLYWAGARRGMRYELTQAAGGRTFIRYLPAGVKVGDRRPGFLAIGTYVEQGAFAQTRAAGQWPGGVTMKLSRAGLAVYNRGRPTSVYFAYPGSDVQVEVFDPTARVARRLVLAGRVVPIR
jgi:hypothetical protein